MLPSQLVHAHWSEPWSKWSQYKPSGLKGVQTKCEPVTTMWHIHFDSKLIRSLQKAALVNKYGEKKIRTLYGFEPACLRYLVTRKPMIMVNRISWIPLELHLLWAQYTIYTSDSQCIYWYTLSLVSLRKYLNT